MSRLALAATLAATLLLVPGAAGAEERRPDTRASVHVFPGRTTFYVGEVVALRLEIHYDAPWFEKHATPLFRQPMDLPVRANVPVFQPREGLEPMADPPPPPISAQLSESFALGDDVVRVTSYGFIVNGSTIVSLTRRFRLTRPGTITAAAPTLEFAWAERFETDLLGVRTPVDPQRVTVTGTESRLTVLPVPSAGRPADYQGLIGRYTLRARADRAELALGDTLRLTLTIEGEGNHETLAVPGFEGLEAFHLLGTLDEQAPKARTLHIDLVPLNASVREVPALTLAFFDPERGVYDIARSTPIPLTVNNATPPGLPVPADHEAVPGGDGRFLLLAVCLLALLGAGLWLRRRRAQVVRPAEPQQHLEALLARLQRAAGTPAGAPALIDVLAWQLSATPAAVVAPDLAVRLVRSGLPATLAQRAAAAVEAGVAARYAGSHAVSDALPRELIADLEQALRAPRST